jgi:hypothetical protein
MAHNMTARIDIDKINNKEVNIYVETPHKIMLECLAKVSLGGDINVYNELVELICEQFSGNTPVAVYISL